MNAKRRTGLLVFYGVLAAVLIVPIARNAADSLLGSCPKGEITAMPRPYAGRGGFAWAASMPKLNDIADRSEQPFQSGVVVCEDGKRIGPEHSMGSDIVNQGRGRYVHWREEGIVFSASDNSDPNGNGRNYIAVRP